MIACFSVKAPAQFTLCTTVPLSYDSIHFTTGIPASFGDSMVTFQITNQHPTQSFAYPLAKLVPLTPLPAGMALSNGSPWTVFASSWNPGITMTVPIFYDVASPIPPDYIVTFQLWVSNLIPLLPDSCYFDSTFTINLNPTALSINSISNNEAFNIIYDYAQQTIQIISQASLQNTVNISLFELSGNKVYDDKMFSGTNRKRINVAHLLPGIYIISLFGENFQTFSKRIILRKE